MTHFILNSVTIIHVILVQAPPNLFAFGAENHHIVCPWLLGTPYRQHMLSIAECSRACSKDTL